MLHIVNKSPYEKNSLETCLRLSQPGSEILLIEDAIYAALKGGAMVDVISSAMSEKKFYVLGPDLRARGVQEERVLDGIEEVDYEGFVNLAAGASNTQSWM